MHKILFCFSFFVSALFSLPVNIGVEFGEIECTSTESSLHIKSGTDAALLNWETFSIGTEEWVDFSLPRADSVVVNRAIGSSPSSIFGSLTSNGKVVLINPQGIVFGKSSEVNTASLIASTLDLNSKLFLEQGEFEFSGDSEMDLINEGSISAMSGDLFLVGKKVQNRGTLVAAGDMAGVIGANSLRLEKGGIYVRYTGDTKDSQNPYANAFSVVEGTITNPGGKVFVLGDTVGISKTALFDVSHDTLPGEIFIGGDFQGKNPDLLNANWTFVESGASIRADALVSGDGGRVIVWSDGDTVFQGEISARGQTNGGFAEVSGKNVLHFEGMANLQGENGAPGTLLLDPTQITIGAATAGVALGNCGFPGNTYASTIAAGTLLALGGGSLSAVLTAGTSVIVTTADGTCGPFAGTGDIIVTGAVTWSALPAALTLNATRDIIVNASIQESNAFPALTNRVTLLAGRNITIGGAAAGRAGSQNAGTLVTAGGDITIGQIGQSQIGFSGIVLCTGSIVVNCNNLSLLGGVVNSPFSSRIGHGRLSAAGVGPSTMGANITVNALGNIFFQNGRSTNCHAKIGHGSATQGLADSLDGNITVLCGGNLSMIGVNVDLGGTPASMSIGHGPGGGVLPPGVSTATYSGDIDIQVANNLTISAAFGAGILIGHGSLFALTNVMRLTGDISLCCGGNADIQATTVLGHNLLIVGAGYTIDADYDISIGGNLSISNTSPLQSGAITIGYSTASGELLTGTLNVSVCGNVTLAEPTAGGNDIIAIGYISNDTTSGAFTNIAIGGNLTGTNLANGLRIASQGDLNFVAGGDVTISMAAGNNDGFISSGLTSGAGLTPSTTRIYTGGSLLLSSNGTSVISVGISPFPAGLTLTTTNIDVRAGGDIQWANTYSGALLIPGSISIQAGHTFASGEIWTGNATQLTSVASQPLVPAFNLGCGACGQFTLASPAITPGCGAFNVQSAASGGPATPVNFSTGAGQPLTLTSLCTACSGSASPLMIGAPVGNNIQFGGAPGTTGPLNLGAFNVIDINQNITSTGMIDVYACHDLNLNPGFAVTSSGAGSPITLIADVDNSGQGDLNLNGGNITSNNGQICLMAGPGTFGCSTNNCLTGPQGLVQGASSSVNQTSGTVSSGTAPTIVVASGNILIDGASPSIITTSGAIAMTAGDSITINQDITSGSGAITSLSGEDTTVDAANIATAGEIRMIAGNDFTLLGAATITSTGNSVTLVADNQFPAQPFIGTGSFNMSCTAQISSGAGRPVRIFTALQGSNTFCSTARINGFLVSDPQFGFPGPLFQDTAYEMWCTYFGCPSPYPFSGLGFPFTVFYKDCLQQATQEATIIADQLLVSFHPYNEFPGWMARFLIEYDGSKDLEMASSSHSGAMNEPYMLRRRQINLLNQPKTYTQIIPTSFDH